MKYNKYQMKTKHQHERMNIQLWPRITHILFLTI